MTSFKPIRLRSGAIIQAGLDPRSAGTARPNSPKQGSYKAVVVKSYVHDDPENERRALKVTADVILVTSQVPLYRVGVLQPNYGVNNVHSLWVPQDSTRSLTSEDGVLLQKVSPQGTVDARSATPFDELDGDQVLVTFVEGDLDYPVIIGALPHERTNRVIVSATAAVPTEGTPQKRDHYIAHHGAEQRIDEYGNMWFSTTAAYGTDKIEEDPANGRGHVTFKVKDSRNFDVMMGNDVVFRVWKDGSQLKVDLGEGAGQRLILGDDFRSFLNTFFAQKFDLHTHTASGSTTTAPLAAFVGTLMGDDVLSDLARTKK